MRTTPDVMEARENQREQGLRQTKHDWHDAGDGDVKNRVQMTSDERHDANDSQALTDGEITKNRALVVRISYLSQDRPAMEICCAMANLSASDLGRVKRIGRYLVVKPPAECLFHWQQSGELQAYSDAEWEGDNVTRQSVSAGVIMRGGHCLKVWTKKQQVVSLSIAESELYAAAKTASEGLGIQSVAKDLGIICGAEPRRCAWSTAEDWARRNTSTCKFCGYRRHPSEAGSSRRKCRLDDETTLGTKDRAACENHGL